MADSRTDDADEQESVHVSTEDRHRILADQRRKHALEVVQSRLPPIPLSDVAREVATKADDVPSQRAVEISLHHRHLPLLDRIDVVDYDRDGNRVTACRATLDQLTV
ncbi:DUF7344 domain-containing protein [Haloarchaeobius sp. HRN-SO-5]|uniref:DUF7344 domain-containing protein n=1 Tax=Haloarchaeobius sp. HRN-SO-5 TaxID=3446118 RepID=UPI003EC04F3C